MSLNKLCLIILLSTTIFIEDKMCTTISSEEGTVISVICS